MNEALENDWTEENDEDTASTYESVDFLAPKRSLEEVKAIMAQERKAKIRRLLFEAPKEAVKKFDDLGDFESSTLHVLERHRKFKVLDLAATQDPPTLVGLLSCRDFDERGPDTPLDSKGRTALHLVCMANRMNLNKTQTGRAHSLEVLEDLVHAGCSWTVQDRFGNTPWDLAPDWLKESICELQRQLTEIKKKESTHGS